MSSRIQHLLNIVLEIDTLIRRLEREDDIYGDLWQNFASCEKERLTIPVIELLLNEDIKEAESAARTEHKTVST